MIEFNQRGRELVTHGADVRVRLMKHASSYSMVTRMTTVYVLKTNDVKTNRTRGTMLSLSRCWLDGRRRGRRGETGRLAVGKPGHFAQGVLGEGWTELHLDWKRYREPEMRSDGFESVADNVCDRHGALGVDFEDALVVYG